jgi:hypothetical protein
MKRFMPIVVVVGAVPLILVLATFSTRAQTNAPTSPPRADAGAPPPPQQQMPVVIAATVPLPPQTSIESLATRKGAVILKGFGDPVVLNGDDGSLLRMTTLLVSDATNNVSESGLVFGLRSANRSADQETVGYLDRDEIDAVLAALDSFAKFDPSPVPTPHVEGRFRTRGDLEFGNLEQDGGRTLAVTNAAALPGGIVMEGSVHFRLSRLDELRQMLTTAKQQLDKLTPSSK